MKFVFGLGNPEPTYSHTRHNVGKDVINLLADGLCSQSKWKRNEKLLVEVLECFLGQEKVLFFKPILYMNECGKAVSRIVNYFNISLEDLLFAYDELDLVIGEYKFAKGKGSKLHNGISSIVQQLGSRSCEEFWHLRIGVRDPKIPMSVQKYGKDPKKYVLSKFNMSDRKKIRKLAKEPILSEINSWLSKIQ